MHSNENRRDIPAVFVFAGIKVAFPNGENQDMLMWR
jgi:hypothetical protein